jgi:hypothetical protein
MVVVLVRGLLSVTAGGFGACGDNKTCCLASFAPSTIAAAQKCSWSRDSVVPAGMLQFVGEAAGFDILADLDRIADGAPQLVSLAVLQIGTLTPAPSRARWLANHGVDRFQDLSRHR